MNKLKKLGITVLSILSIFALCVPLVACGGDEPQPEVKDEYSVTFDYNYTGAPASVVKKVKSGRRVAAVSPDDREGFAFVGWYEQQNPAADAEPFDFITLIEKDYTLYAKWDEQAVEYTVTFDTNYSRGKVTSVKVVSGEYVPTDSVPRSERLGYNITGWCTDKTDPENTAFDIATDKVTGDTTLYALYELDPSLPLDDNGDIKFENVQIRMAWQLYGTSNAKDSLQKAVSMFNSQHDGEIEVTITDGNKVEWESDWAEKYSDVIMTLKPAMSAFSNTYYGEPVVPAINSFYTAADVFDLAGIEYNANDYYTDAVRDCYLNGELFSVPVAANVPCFVYNKSLLNTYNDGVAPTNYSSLAALLKRAYQGEHNSAFAPAAYTKGWEFSEIASYASFIQNDSVYYNYKDGKLVNDWPKGEENVKSIAALNNLNDIFGVKGSCKGVQKSLGEIRSGVQSGNVFFGLDYSSQAMYAITNSSTDILSLSGLFTDDGENKAQIPVYNFGMQFYKNKDRSLVEYAAAAVFADWLSKNCDRLATSTYLYPLNKTVAQRVLAGTDTDSANARELLTKVGDPLNFRTLDGFEQLKDLVAKTLGDNKITVMLQDPQWDPKYDALATAYDMRKIIEKACEGQVRV